LTNNGLYVKIEMNTSIGCSWFQL